jgi:hypothetical protein
MKPPTLKSLDDAVIRLITWSIQVIASSVRRWLRALTRTVAFFIALAALPPLLYAAMYRALSFLATNSRFGALPNVRSPRSVNRACYGLFLIFLTVHCLRTGRTAVNVVCIDIVALYGAHLAETTKPLLCALRQRQHVESQSTRNPNDEERS